MIIRFDRFPGGVHKALTLSYDDGRIHDRRLVDMMNRYGLKGTFHLNSGYFGREGYITADETAELFQGHEISVHTVDHPFLEQSPPEQIANTILEDRKALEALAGYPVKGMSYPYGTYNDRVVAMLPALGIEYARTTASHGKFDMPNDLLRWHPTCHHKQMLDLMDSFLTQPRHTKMKLFYIWGHSYEFENNRNWELIDRLGERLGGRDDIWYATNAEIAAYMKAIERLCFSADCRIIHNPSAVSVWVSADGDALEIPAGQTIRI
jgi:hypothetical protein